MPIWAVEFYDEEFNFRGPRRGVIKASCSNEAGDLAKANMGTAVRVTLTPMKVPDENAFQNGYSDIPSN